MEGNGRQVLTQYTFCVLQLFFVDVEIVYSPVSKPEQNPRKALEKRQDERGMI